MIKTVTQYVVVCDNNFCDSVMRAGVDCHSDERKEQFKKKIINRGWVDVAEGENFPEKYICPSCQNFESGVFR